MKTLLSNLWKLVLLRLVVKAGLVPELRERLIASELQNARLQWKLQHLRDWSRRSAPQLDAHTYPGVSPANFQAISCAVNEVMRYERSYLREELEWLDAL